MADRLARLMRPTQPDVRPSELKVKYFPAQIVIGDFKINTTSSGAIETVPTTAPPTQEPADILRPASLRLRANDINLEASAEFGGAILLSDLMNALLDTPGIISLAGEEMSVRSALGRILLNLSGLSSSVADISGVRIPAVLNEVVNNASLDEARALAQGLKDAAQDASGALLALSAATAASDLSGVLVRVSALESAPGFDASALEGRLTAAEAAIGGKADQAAVDAALLEKLDNSTYNVLVGQVTLLETASSGFDGRITAVEGALPSKVAQADYDVYVAATDAAIASAAAAAAAAASDASAANTLAAAAEVKGLMSKMIVEYVSVVGVSAAYWLESIGSVLAGHMMAGKLAEFNFDAPLSEITLAPASPVANSLMRLKNGHASADLAVSLGGTSYVLVAGEIMSWVYDGSAWKML